ncbi:MAG: tetratricopeptide repeat protein [Candidatus Rokubacteria bacterium]|nr:tetratricopeptide repeat protein [Candidatus Rokubacteria bacterium]
MALAAGQGDRHSLGITYHQIGLVHQEQKQYVPALEWYQKAVEAKEVALAAGQGEEYSLSLTFYAMSLVYEATNDIADAIRYMEKSVEALQRINHLDLQQRRARLENLKKRTTGWMRRGS